MSQALAFTPILGPAVACLQLLGRSDRRNRFLRFEAGFRSPQALLGNSTTSTLIRTVTTNVILLLETKFEPFDERIDGEPRRGPGVAAVHSGVAAPHSYR